MVTVVVRLVSQKALLDPLYTLPVFQHLFELLPQHPTQTSLTWSTIEVGVDQEPRPRAQMVTGFDPPGIQTWVIKKELGSYQSLTRH